MPKGVVPGNYFRSCELLSITDAQWRELKTYIPDVPPEVDGLLRSRLLECCSWFLTENGKFNESLQTFTAMQRPGKGQPAAIERLAKGLRMAADAWPRAMGMHDDRLGDIRQYNDLEAMARDVERRLAAFRKFGKPAIVTDPWPSFVRKAAQCFREVGIIPTVTGRIYLSSWGTKPTWFQKFFVGLNKTLLGKNGRRQHTPAAFYAEITKAMRPGNRKSGKARK
jgi:hypothetical protein